MTHLSIHSCKCSVQFVIFCKHNFYFFNLAPEKMTLYFKLGRNFMLVSEKSRYQSVWDSQRKTFCPLLEKSVAFFFFNPTLKQRLKRKCWNVELKEMIMLGEKNDFFQWEKISLEILKQPFFSLPPVWDAFCLTSISAWTLSQHAVNLLLPLSPRYTPPSSW